MAKEAGSARLFKFEGVDVTEAFGIGELIGGAVRWGKVKLFNTLFGSNWWTELFDIIEDSDTAKTVGVSPSAIVSVIARYLEKTCEVSMAVGEEIGSESIMEMLSEGLSSAMETNFNASIQTILNIKRGSLPPDLSVALQIGQRLDRVDTMYALSQIMAIGNLNYTILEALLAGADQRFINAVETALALYDQALTEKNQAIHTHIIAISQLLTNIYNDLILDCVSFIERLNSLITNVANEHLARVNQLEDNLDSVKALYDNGLLSDEEYDTKLIEIDAQLTATESVYDDYIATITDLISDYVTKLDTIKDDVINIVLGYLNTVESVYNAYINGILNAINSITLNDTLKDKALELYNRLKAIRQYGYTYA